MKISAPRHPIVIIGAGIAGLAAASALREKDIPCIILERFHRPGGRLNSRGGEGWLADHGAQFFRRSDETLVNLVRSVGFERNRVAVQGGVYRLTEGGEIVVPTDGGVDPNRLCIDIGFSAIADRLAEPEDVRYSTAISAVRWSNGEKVFWWESEGQVFWFEDEAGEPVRNPITQQVLLASGVILATTATAATQIARKSPALEDLESLLDSVKYTRSFTGMYRIPRQKIPFYALEGEPGAAIAWLAFEENKTYGRVDAEHSLLVVQAANHLSDHLMTVGDGAAMMQLYAEVRNILPQLPDRPLSCTHKRWNVAQVASQPLGIPPSGRWDINPSHAPFALAGDYVLGSNAEAAARSGIMAAELVINQLPTKRSFLGIQLQR